MLSIENFCTAVADSRDTRWAFFPFVCCGGISEIAGNWNCGCSKQ